MDGPEQSFTKKVDENWKEQVEKERRAPQGESPRPAQPQAPPQRKVRSGPAQPPAATEFGLFLSSLSMQVLIALGEMPHPATQEPQEDLEQARYLIDVLGTLQEKTQGNLSQEEAALLEGLLYELRMKYVSRSQGAAQ